MELNSDSRTKNASKNAVSALANKLCILFLTFVGRKFFIQFIGVEYLGINGLFGNVLTLLSMADLGLGTAMNVSLYKPIAENDTKKLSALLNYYRHLYYVIAIAVTIIGLGLIPFLPYIVKLESEIPHLYVYYVVFVLKNTFSYLFIYKQSIISADQKNYLVNEIDVYVSIFRVIAQIVSVILFKNYFVYIVIDLLAIIVHNLVISYVADKQYPFLKEEGVLSKEEKKVFFNDMYSAFLYKIAGSILGGTDNILISMIVGTVAVGLYSNYNTITNNLETFIMLLFTSLTASVGNLVATSNAEKRYSVFKTMQMVGNWLGAYVTICLLFLSQDFIVLWLNKEMLLDSYVLVAIVINMYYTICMRPVWTFREGTGMYRQIRYIMFATAIVNIVLSIVMGKIWGVGGILLATSIAKFTTCYWYEPRLLYKNFFKIKASKYYCDYFANVLLTIGCGILCYLPISMIKSISVRGWILKCIVCTVIVNAVYLLRYFKTPEFYSIKQKVARVILDKKHMKHR